MKPKDFTPRLRSTLFTALTGRAGDVSGKADADPAGMLLAAFGEGRRGGVNTRAAAQGLGVSQRTVQRWLAPEGHQRSRPSAGHRKTLTASARRAATTKQGRRRALADARDGAKARRITRLSVTGMQGPTVDGKEYRRYRKVDINLDPDAVESMWGAYEDGGDKGLVSWLAGYAGDEYVPDWGFDSIDDLQLGR